MLALSPRLSLTFLPGTLFTQMSSVSATYMIFDVIMGLWHADRLGGRSGVSGF